MNGIKHISISNRFAKFEFELCRNITIVRGNSGTGKTTLFQMVVDYTRDKEKSGVNISAPCPCVALVDINWQAQLDNIRSSIVFIDEDSDFIRSEAFAKAVKDSDNYYVLFTREDLHELPYSINEIYEIKTSGKYHSFVKLHKSKSANGFFSDEKSKKKIDAVLVEDTKAGFEFFSAVFGEKGLPCETSGSNAGVYAVLKENKSKKYLVIADGAAFGSEIDRVLKLRKAGVQMRLYLPESFEWMILKSGLIESVASILAQPSGYIFSEDYFSWERYFTALLTEKTRGSFLAYSKSRLNKNYLNDREKSAIMDVMPVEAQKLERR